MALMASLATLLAVAIFAYVMAALGHRILRLIGLQCFGSQRLAGSELIGSELILCSIALGVITLQVGLFIAEVLQAVRIGVFACLIAAVIFGARDLPVIFQMVRSAAHSIFSGPRTEKLLAAMTGLVLAFEGLAAMAPLTGSDAMRCHFTVPLLILRTGFHPNFFLAHSFFCGQAHLLILAGLAVGSEKLAMGLLFLGGALAAGALVCLAREWMLAPWAWAAGLAFLLTPLVFWQISTAGVPDIWMSFYATVGVIVIARCNLADNQGGALLLGILAGAIAGTKYTGCIVAASLALAFLWESRSLRGVAVFLSGAFAAGIWPYARNVVWTGDPFFPFFMRWLAPSGVNSYTLASFLASTGADESRSLWQMVKFPVFAAFDGSQGEFWEFLGPLVLVFFPLMILAVRNTPAWRASLAVWFGSALGIGATSGTARFLLPVLPIALTASFAGVSHVDKLGWRLVRRISVATIGLYLLFGLAGLLLYGRAAIAVAVGLNSRENYLQQRAPNYEQAEFVNRALQAESREGKILVFFRHTYYLDVPFVYGDPYGSWAIDPERFKTPQAWRELFRKEKIRWVVRSPDYPDAIAEPLLELEKGGELIPLASGEVDDFAGVRVLGQRKTVPIVVLRVGN
ncbi:MAG: hypothetical protein WBV69_01935 [Candidatus Sulfotelmatobacter sp.]